MPGGQGPFNKGLPKMTTPDITFTRRNAQGYSCHHKVLWNLDSTELFLAMLPGILQLMRSRQNLQISELHAQRYLDHKISLREDHAFEFSVPLRQVIISISSGFGLHLVFMPEKSADGFGPLATVERLFLNDVEKLHRDLQELHTHFIQEDQACQAG